MNNELLDFDDALERLLAAARPLGEIEDLSLADADGRILAAPLVASCDVPPLDNSAMDGYAVRCADLPAAGVRLPVSQRITAGNVGQPLAAVTAARIFTGAPVPENADAVVMQERCRREGDAVFVDHVPRAGENIRRRGEDIRAGATILAAGVRLAPQALGLAAAVGVARVPVVRRLRVALFFTGDELAMPGQPLAPGAIYNANRFVLIALLERLGCAVIDLGAIPDTLAATRAALRRAAAEADLVLASGGVSVGEEDHVKPAVEAEGELVMWKLAIKPGKPLAHGRVGTADFIGLPGNPVSAFVTFLMLVRPFILRRMGVVDCRPRRMTLPAGFDWLRPDKRREFLRVRRGDDDRLEPFPNQGSGVLSSTVWADGLLEVMPGQVIHAGDAVRYIPFGDLLS